MYARLFSTVAVVMSATLASALAQVDENGQPIQYLSGDWQRELEGHLHKYMRSPNREGRIVIKLVLSPAGHIVSATVEKSSGDAVLDKAALVMVRQAHPVPPPPPFALKDQRFIVYSLRYSR
jgi:TonB family protein